MNIEDLTIKEARKLAALFGGSSTETAFEVGESYFIRTVTHYYTGRLVRVTPTELILEDAAWIADTGRFADAMATGSLSEVEPYPNGARVLVSRGGLIDAVKWTHPLPRKQK